MEPIITGMAIFGALMALAGAVDAMQRVLDEDCRDVRNDG